MLIFLSSLLFKIILVLHNINIKILLPFSFCFREVLVSEILLHLKLFLGSRDSGKFFFYFFKSTSVPLRSMHKPHQIIFPYPTETQLLFSRCKSTSLRASATCSGNNNRLCTEQTSATFLTLKALALETLFFLCIHTLNSLKGYIKYKLKLPMAKVFIISFSSRSHRRGQRTKAHK